MSQLEDRSFAAGHQSKWLRLYSGFRFFDSLRLGRGQGVGQKAVENIISERDANGSFSNLFEFCLRVDGQKCNKRACEALITSGSLDPFGGHRAALLRDLPAALSLAGQHQDTRLSGQGDMFGLQPPENAQEKNSTG